MDVDSSHDDSPAERPAAANEARAGSARGCARAGAVVGRMLQAGYTAKQANLAISALYVSRNQRALVSVRNHLVDYLSVLGTFKF